MLNIYVVELKFRILYSIIFFIELFCLFYVYAPLLIYILIKPLFYLLNTEITISYFIFPGLQEVFSSYFYVIILFSGFITQFFFLFQFFFFLQTSLFYFEQCFLLIIFSTSLFFFLIGLLFSYLLFIPLLLKILLGFYVVVSSKILFPIFIEPHLQIYIYLIVNMLIFLSGFFQIPVFFLIGFYFNCFTLSTIFKNRLFLLLLFSFLVSLFIPLDYFSQIIFVFILFFLFYFCLLFIVFIFFYFL